MDASQRNVLLDALALADKAGDQAAIADLSNQLSQMDAAAQGSPEAAPDESFTLTDYVAGLTDSYHGAVGKLSDTMSNVSGLAGQEEELLGVPEDQRTRQIGSAEASLQALGSSAGLLGDSIGSTIVAGADAVIPEAAQQYAKGALDELMSTQLGQNGLKLLQKGGKAWQAFQKKHPETAKSLVAAVDFGSLILPATKAVGPVQGAAKVTRPVTKGVGDAVEATGETLVRSSKTARAEDVAQLLAPKNRMGKGGTTTETWARNRKYEPNDYNKAVAETVAEVPKVKPHRTATYNNQHVREAAEREARELEGRIMAEGNPVIVAPKGSGIGLPDGSIDLDVLDDVLVGDAKKYAAKFLNKANEFIEESDGTALGLLKVRRKLDRWAEDNVGRNYDPTVVSARNVAQKAVRDNLNTLVDESVPNAGVRASLKKQSQLYSASDALQAKMKSEGVDMLDRFLKGLSTKHLGPAGALGVTSAVAHALGYSTLAAASTALGGAVGIAAAISMTPKGKARSILGKMIMGTGKALKKATDPEVIKQLKADRLLMIDMLQTIASMGGPTGSQSAMSSPEPELGMMSTKM